MPQVDRSGQGTLTPACHQILSCEEMFRISQHWRSRSAHRPSLPRAAWFRPRDNKPLLVDGLAGEVHHRTRVSAYGQSSHCDRPVHCMNPNNQVSKGKQTAVSLSYCDFMPPELHFYGCKWDRIVVCLVLHAPNYPGHAASARIGRRQTPSYQTHGHLLMHPRPKRKSGRVLTADAVILQ
jgi:hypothetical protein